MKEWADKGFWREDVLNYKGDNRAELEAGNPPWISITLKPT